MTITIAAIGRKADVEKTLTGDLVRVWDGKGEVRVRPTSPIRWTPSPLERGKWRGEREAEPVG